MHISVILIKLKTRDGIRITRYANQIVPMVSKVQGKYLNLFMSQYCNYSFSIIDQIVSQLVLPYSSYKTEMVQLL